MKATHIVSDFAQPQEIVRKVGKTDWSKNWVVSAGEVKIVANSNVDAVEYAAHLAGKEYAVFNGALAAGMRRRMRQAIAEYLDVAWQDVQVVRREVFAGNSHYGMFSE